jgi:hypothetical protein
MNKYIRTLTILFDTDIRFKEIPLFRGAVLKVLGDKVNLLYHNHTSNDTFRYSYPLIQYKCIHGKAAIVCIDEAVDLIGQLLTKTDGHLMIGEREVTCQTNRIQPARKLLQTWEEPFRYHISHWLPLNARNYQLYKSTENVVERVTLLESILKGNLLSMLKGLDIHLEQELMVRFAKLSDSYLLYNKGIGMTAFDADFVCNLTIPNYVGIGKNASIGFGVVCQERKKSEKTNQSK